MNKTPQRILRDLAQPFKINQLEWRVQAVGITNGKPWARVLAYVTSRDMQQRLDDVVGCFGWKNEFAPLPNSVGEGAMCGISIKFDGEWITKWNGAENTHIEAVKGGLSAAEKRAAVEWGIGRYLYDVDAMYAQTMTDDQYKAYKEIDKNEWERAFTKDDTPIWWKPPTLPEKFRQQPLAAKSVRDDILKLARETKVDLPDLLLEHIGVTEVHDLYKNEAARVIDYLIRVKQKQDEEKKDEN